MECSACGQHNLLCLGRNSTPVATGLPLHSPDRSSWQEDLFSCLLASVAGRAGRCNAAARLLLWLGHKDYASHMHVMHGKWSSRIRAWLVTRLATCVGGLHIHKCIWSPHVYSGFMSRLLRVNSLNLWDWTDDSFSLSFFHISIFKTLNALCHIMSENSPLWWDKILIHLSVVEIYAHISYSRVLCFGTALSVGNKKPALFFGSKFRIKTLSYELWCGQYHWWTSSPWSKEEVPHATMTQLV